MGGRAARRVAAHQAGSNASAFEITVREYRPLSATNSGPRRRTYSARLPGGQLKHL